MADVTLGTKLKELRKLNNYPQEYVASSLGIIRQTYSHYETGKRMPSPEMLYKLSLLYNISVESLMKLTMDVEENIYYDAPGISEEVENVSRLLDFLICQATKRSLNTILNLRKNYCIISRK